MSEMLANHYFMIRDFEKAADAYETAVSKCGMSSAIRKKMIICYIKTHQMKKALFEFFELVESDIHFLINTDLNSDDCPCPDIISEIERDEINFKDEYERMVALGMLWLYCDIKQSKIHFTKAWKIKQNDERIFQMIQLLNSKKDE